MSSLMSMARRFMIARAILARSSDVRPSRSTSDAMMSTRSRSAGATLRSSRTEMVLSTIFLIIWAGVVPGSKV